MGRMNGKAEEEPRFSRPASAAMARCLASAAAATLLFLAASSAAVDQRDDSSSSSLSSSSPSSSSASDLSEPVEVDGYLVDGNEEGSGSSALWDGLLDGRGYLEDSLQEQDDDDDDANKLPEEAVRAQAAWTDPQDQADQPQAAVEDGSEDLEGPVDGVSLTFVFDSTGSMWDDLVQLRAGADKIMSTILQKPDNPIYNYVLVPFSDPDVGPVTVTRDHSKFRQSLKDVRINGGGDCPEASIKAITKALEVSLPRSFIFVFTDAYAKDYRLTPHVLSLVQKKQSQVAFLLTGRCEKEPYESYLVYEKIAATSLGQVFRIGKENIEELLQYVRHSLTTRRVNLMSVSSPANETGEHQLHVDESLSEFTVSVSGHKPTINVTDPAGEPVEGPPRLKPLVKLENVTVVNVQEPEPGPWTLKVTSDTDHIIRSTGVSTVDFVTKFSVAPTHDMHQASHRPLKGVNSRVLTMATESGRVHNLTEVRLVSLNNSVLVEIPLEKVPGSQEMHVGGPVFPPYEFFYIEVNGFDKDGYPIKRISPTAISSQDPAPPIVTMQPHTAGWVGDPAVLTCHVESLIPFKVIWYKDGRPVSVYIMYQQTSKVPWNIQYVTPSAEGNYVCSAKNSAGMDKKTTYLSVSGPPPEVLMADQVLAPPNSSALLDCKVRSLLPYNVSWVRTKQPPPHNPDDLEQIEGDQRVSVAANGTLIIGSVTTEDEGWYVCISENKGGRGRGSVFLGVREPIAVTVFPKEFTFTQGENVTIYCTASGIPKPKATWIKNGSKILDLPNSRIKLVEVQNGIQLMIQSASSMDEGIYQCEAENDLETVVESSEARYVEAPRVTVVEEHKLVKVGDEVTLGCHVTGTPEPSVAWSKLQQDMLGRDDYHAEDDGSLTLTNVQLTDAGKYVCIGANEAGMHSGTVMLDVGTAPEVLQSSVDVEVKFNGSSSIPCMAAGSPAPTIIWLHEDGSALDKGRFSVTATGTLQLTGARIDDQDTYVCTVKNALGTVQMPARLVITGYSAPVLDELSTGPDVTLVRGESARLECRALLGEPPPSVSWLKDGEPLHGQWPGLIVDDHGSLNVNYAVAQLQGTYDCVATNVAGSTTRTTNIRVLEPPSFQAHAEFQGQVYKVVAGESTQLPCQTRGQPKPMVTWEKDGMPLQPRDNVFKNQEDDSLVIINAIEGDSGTYTCIAANYAGAENKSFAVFVQVPATIATSSSDLTTIEGGRVNMYCVVEAVPPATVTWYRNNSSLPEDRYEMVFMASTAKLSFVANFSDNGIFKCVAENEVGTDETEIQLEVVVPPGIFPLDDQFMKVNAGESVAFECQVSGYPQPIVLWQKNGATIVNSTNISISADNTLQMVGVQPNAAGVYVCNAESPAGITQRAFYLIVHIAPKIREDLPNYIHLKEGEDYALPCSADGIPTPSVTWRKDDTEITSNQYENLSVLEDSTLIMTSASPSTTGLYTCTAENIDGEDTKHFIVEVMVPPSTNNPQVTRLEVIDGDSVSMTCPDIEAFPPPKYIWLKEGGALYYFPSSGSNADHFNFKDKGRTLMIREAGPADNGNYTCIVKNQAGETEAPFRLDVLALPRFEHPNQDRSSGLQDGVVEGSRLVLKCFSSGNPPPKVSWRKNDVPVTPHTAPGVVLSSEGQVLTIPRTRPHDSGRYRCAAFNKVGHAHQDFHITVMVPPRVDGQPNEVHEVVEGEPVLLQCPITGIPEPKIHWSRDGRSLQFNEDQDMIVSDDKRILELSTTEKYDEGIYTCMGTNAAGSQTKFFNVTVLEAPQIKQEHFIEELRAREGGSIELTCAVTGFPEPQVIWLHNGRILGAGEVDANSLDVGILQGTRKHLLALHTLDISAGGKYTCLASNKVGVAEKNFRLKVLMSPKMQKSSDLPSSTIESLEGLPVAIRCPVVGEPGLDVHWTKDDRPLEQAEMLVSEAEEDHVLHISAGQVQHSGNYTCMVTDAAGNISQSFQLDVMAPPAMADEQEQTDHILRTGETLRLYCNVMGHPPPAILWLKGTTPISDRQDLHVALDDLDRTLVIHSATMDHRGQYSCLANNKAGTTEMTFNVEVQESPHVDNLPLLETNHTVKLHRRLVLKCPLIGSPVPMITWYKDGVAVSVHPESASNVHVSSDGKQLHLIQALAKDEGEYSCLAENSAGSSQVFFSVHVQVPVEWGPWSPWSDCSTTCGQGERVRVRQCGDQDAPDPPHATACPGDAVETQACVMSICQVDGGWGDWTNWTSCSVSCGRGTRRRYRKCDRPEPAYGGRPCFGSDGQQEACMQNPCPVHGGWSQWSTWSDCSASCDEGSRYRTRACNNPIPAYSGATCDGANMETDSCNVRKCPVDGGWSQWGQWTQCSMACGPGFRRRYRTCSDPEPQFDGAPCTGDNLQIEKCEGTTCNRFPQAAELRVTGMLNGQNLGQSVITARIQDRGPKTVVTATTQEILKYKAKLFPYVPFVLSPVLWNTAKEEEAAHNGYSLTQGNFRQNSLMEFVGGEELRVTHTGRGLDEYGTLRVDIEVNGAVPFVLPKATVVIKPYEEDYIQTGPNTLFASSTNVINVDGKEVEYSWNNTVHYDSLQGTMPYLVEKLSAGDIGMQFDPELEEIQVSISSTITRKFDKDKCPEGFALNEKFMHCADVNECRDKLTSGCHYTQQCENLFGSYRCYCRPGFIFLGAGKRCQDINECDQYPPVCSQICRNKKGSYKCSCYPGYVMQSDSKTCTLVSELENMSNEAWYLPPSAKNFPSLLSNRSMQEYSPGLGCPSGYQQISGVCQDVDECLNVVPVCSSEQTCLNTRGGFRCLETPCPQHFERDSDSRHCVQFCDEEGSQCSMDTQLMETVIYTTLTPEPSTVHPYKDLMVLSVHGEDDRKLTRTRYHIVENEIGKPFRVRFENGQGILYVLRHLKEGVIHRVSILASSYDEGERSILYTTKFVIFILLPEEL